MATAYSAFAKVNIIKASLATLMVGVFSINTAFASVFFNASLVADNDFAVFSGTDTSVNNLLFQNNLSWYDQKNVPSLPSLSLAAGDTNIYLLAMGGGGSQENISGIINGINITDPSLTVSMSSDLAPYLTGYNNSDVAHGTYDAQLVDVQNAFSSLTWGAPALNSSQTVIQQAGFGQGFIFGTSTAHLFKFSASQLGVTKVPEPSILALMGFGFIGLSLVTRRKKR